MSIEGLIFDFDGTLADTMPLHWRVWQGVAQRHGFRFTQQEFYALGGVPSREIVRHLARGQSLELDVLAVAREKEEGYLDRLAEIRPIEPIVAIVRRHFGELPMAVASGGSRRVIGRALEQLGLRDFFDVVVTNEDVQRHKPAPDTFLEAARRLNVSPARCQAYEDTDIGLEAIRAAGMQAVDVRKFLRLHTEGGSQVPTPVAS
ncbi:MAG TPA: HAD-IA family hydrolase [Candidatus Paceibacterota bacterium]|nr:HAD-IA family hydrolase [Verrucomicrobiota bacterium]HOX04698.1 HAD-IA family hydrolase [Verrucomicrobiota bacterium]HRZ47678.1 HAD-IA family hydrolase [Candidatus Paceibacterota bacterium]